MSCSKDKLTEKVFNKISSYIKTPHINGDKYIITDINDTNTAISELRGLLTEDEAMVVVSPFSEKESRVDIYPKMSLLTHEELSIKRLNNMKIQYAKYLDDTFSNDKVFNDTNYSTNFAKWAESNYTYDEKFNYNESDNNPLTELFEVDDISESSIIEAANIKNRLNELSDRGISVSFNITDSEQSSYDDSTRQVNLNLNQIVDMSKMSGIPVRDVLHIVVDHELLHASTLRGLDNKDFRNEIEKLYDIVVKYNNNNKFIDKFRAGFSYNNGRPYALGFTESGEKALHEFIAESMSNPYFVKYLQSIPYNQSTSIWGKIIDLIRSILGINPPSNIYSEVLSIYNDEQFKEESINDEVSSFQVVSFVNNKPKTQFDVMEDIIISNGLETVFKSRVVDFLDANEGILKAYKGKNKLADVHELGMLFKNKEKYASDISLMLKDMLMLSSTFKKIEEDLNKDLNELKVREKNGEDTSEEQIGVIVQAKLKSSAFSEYFDMLSDVRNDLMKGHNNLDYIIDQASQENKSYAKGLVRLIEIPFSFVEFIDRKIGESIQSPLYQYWANAISDATESSRKSINEELESLNNKLKSTTNQKEIGSISLKIRDLKNQLSTIESKDKDFFESEIKSKNGDINLITSLITALGNSKSVLTQIMFKKYSDINRESDIENIEIANKLQTATDKFLKSKNKTNLDTSVYDEILMEVEIPTEVDVDGNIIKSTKSLSLLSEYSPELYTERERLKKQVSTIRRELLKAASSGDEASKTSLEEKLKEVILKRDLFNKENFEKPFIKKYYDNEDKLNQKLSNGKTVREQVNDIYELISDAESDRDNAISDEERDLAVERIKFLKIELKSIFSTDGKQEGSDDYIVATILKDYYEAKNKFGERVLTEQNLKYFNAIKDRKAEDLRIGRITEEEYNRWIGDNTYIKISSDYFDDLKKLSNQADEYFNEIVKVYEENGLSLTSSKSNTSVLFSEIKDISKVYRDEDGVIQGELVPVKSAEKIHDIQQNIIDIQSASDRMKGLSRKEAQELYDLKKLGSSKTEDDINREEELLSKKSKIDEILSNKDIKVVINGSSMSLKDAIDYYNKIRADISKMNKVSTTDAYEEEMNKRRSEQSSITSDELINQVIELGVEDEGTTLYPIDEASSIIKYNVIIGGDKIVRIVLDENGIITDLITPLVSPNESDVESLLKDQVRKVLIDSAVKNSEWYKTNHITKETWDAELESWKTFDEPIYIWNHTTPSDEKYIEYEHPNSKYTKWMPFDSTKNPNYQKSPDGMPTISKNSTFLNKKYVDLNSSSKEYLESLREIHYNSQEDLPFYNRIGNFIPRSRETDEEAKVKAIKKFGNLKELKGWAKEALTKTEQYQQETGIISDNDVSKRVIPIFYTSAIDSSEQSRNLPGLFLIEHLSNTRYKMLKEIAPIMEQTESIIEGKNRKNEASELNKTYLYGQTSKSLNAFINLPFVGKVSIDKLFGKLISITAWRTFSGNIISPVQNTLGTFFQSIVNMGEKNGWFTKRSMAWAQAEFVKQSKNLVSDYDKYGNKSLIGQMIDYFQVLSHDRSSMIGHKTQWNKYRNFGEILTAPKDLSEYHAQIYTFLAIIKNTIVKDVNGKSISLYEAYEIKNGIISLKDGIQLTKSDENRFKDKLHDIQLKMLGAYRDNQRNISQKYLLGRALFFMNQYLVPGFQHRYGKKSFSLSQERDEEGFYRSSIMGYMVDSVKDGFKFAKNWRNLSDYEKANLSKFAKEVLITSIAMMLASAAIPDDGEEVSTEKKLMLVYAMRTISEMQTFNIVFGADELLRKANSPFMVVKTLSTARNMLYYSLLTVTGDDDAYYKTKYGLYDKGDSKALASFYKLISLGNSSIFRLDIESLYKNQKALYEGGTLR